ncbi:MAG: hypothetical protein AABY84_12160 [Candidatus Firestonebacteria bacterium]
MQEKTTNKWSIVGIFDKILVRNFPSIHPSLSIYMRLTEAEGDYDIRVEFCDINKKKLAIFEGLKLSVPSKLMSPEIGIKTSSLPIPQPGKYLFNLYFNNEFLETHPIWIEQIETKNVLGDDKYDK